MVGTSKSAVPKYFSLTPSIKQNFSLPLTLVYHIAQNPLTPKCYNKVIHCCKYFFEKNPILVVYRIIKDGTIICPNNEDDCNELEQKCCIKINLQNLTSKIWLIDELAISYSPKKDNQNYTSILCPKIFRCEITKLELGSKQIVKFVDFKVLASFAKCVYLNVDRISYSTGDTVVLGNILEACPNIEVFRFTFDDDNNSSVVTASFLKTEHKNLGNLKEFHLWNIPEIFNVEDIYAFITNHKNMKIWFSFTQDYTVEYKNQLASLVGAINESKISNCFIQYDEMDD